MKPELWEAEYLLREREIEKQVRPANSFWHGVGWAFLIMVPVWVLIYWRFR